MNRKNKMNTTVEHFSKERYFEMPNSVVFDYEDDSAINEIFISGGYGIGSKSSIAYVGNDFDAKYLKSSKVYALIKDHNEAIKKSGLTNEAVKIDLVATYIENPREYTSRAISAILNNVNEHYSLTEDEEKIFSSGDSYNTGERQRAIKQLNEKGAIGDKRLVEALKACDFLLETCRKTEEEYEKSYGKTIEKELSKLVDEECFSRQDVFFDFADISESEKNRIFKLFVANANIKKSEISNNAPTFDDLKDALRPYVSNHASSTSSYADIYISIHKRDFEEFVAEEVERAKKLSTQELTFEDLEKIKEKAKIDYVETYKKDDIRNSYIETRLFFETSRLASKAHSIQSLYESARSAIQDSSKINKNIRKMEEFKFLYEQMTKATKAFSIEGDGARDYELKKVQKEILFRYKNSKDFRVFLDEAESFHNKISGESKDFIALLKNGAMSQKDFKSFSSAILEQSLKQTLDELQNSKDENKKITFTKEEKKIIQSNLIELSRRIAEGKEGRIKKPFGWGEIVSVYDDFQEKNILNVTKNRIKNTKGVDSAITESIIRAIDTQLKGKTRTSYMPTDDLKDDIVDIMNFEYISNNQHIQNAIETDEIESTVKQSIRSNKESSVLQNIAKDVFLKKKRYSEAKKKDMSHDERIREVAGHYYSNYASSLMRNSIIGLASKRETFQNFSSCVKGASVMQRNMDTKLSNVSNCLKEFKNSLKKDSEEFQRIISASSQGVGALNPFMHIAQVVALSRTLMAEKIESNMREIANSINGISREVATAETEIERRARNTILMARADNNINIQSVHNSEKNKLEDKLKQEYITREIVDFKEAGTKFSDANPIEILEEYEIPYLPDDIAIDRDTLRNATKIFDGKYKEKDLSNNKYFDLDTENKSKNENYEETAQEKSSKQEKPTAYNTAMIEQAILKMDVIQKKMTEMKLASGNEYSHDDFLNGTTSNEVTAKNFGFVLNSEDEKKELGLESWESKEMRDWMEKNNISKKLLEKSLEKGYSGIEEEKLALSYSLIVKSLEEMKDKSGNEAETIRPKSKINDIINEIKDVFSKDNNTVSKLQKRNILSSAVSMLHSSSNHKRAIEVMFNTSSIETESVESRDNNEISILGVADREKAYILKVHKEQKILEANEEVLREKLSSESDNASKKEIEKMFYREGFEDLSYRADVELLKNTKMSGSETSFSNWSDLLANSTDYTTYNNGVRDINQEMAQISNSSSTGHITQTTAGVNKNDFVSPDDNYYELKR